MNVLPSPDFWVHLSTNVYLWMFSSSIHHYIIWSDKCYLLVHIIVEIHLSGNFDGLSLSPSAPPSSPWFTDELLFWNSLPYFVPENLTMSSRQLMLRPFFSGTPSLRYPDTNQIWISVRYDGWNIFPRVITLVFIWPGKVVSYLALRPYCYSFHF